MNGAVGGVLLLAGLVGVPLALLALGHGLRRRGPVGRGAFWGGVMGYGLGALAWTALAAAPATGWGTGSLRQSAVLGLLLLAGLAGMGAGAAAARRGSDEG